MRPELGAVMEKTAEAAGKKLEEVDLLDDSGRKPYAAELPDDSGEKPYSAELPDDSGEKMPGETAGQEKDEGQSTLRRKETIDGETHYYDDNGKPYRINDDLMANTTYEINSYQYKTDDLGRIASASGKLHLKDREGRLAIADSLAAIGKGDEKEGDNRGHLIGDQFDGGNGLENMVPQDANINQKAFNNFETNELAKAVKEGKEVYVKVIPLYEGDSRRPTEIVVNYGIDGKKDTKIFPND